MSEYRDHAYERTIVSQLQRILLDRYLSSDSPPKEGLVCEEVFRSESEIPQSALLRVFEKLGLWENEQRTRMSTFKFMQEASPLPFLNNNPTQPPSAEAKKNGPAKNKPKRKRTKAPEGTGNGT